MGLDNWKQRGDGESKAGDKVYGIQEMKTNTNGKESNTNQDG